MPATKDQPKSRPLEDVEAGLPEFGKLRGKKVRLVDAARRMKQVDLEQIEVDTPDGVVRPFRFQSNSEEISVSNGKIVL